ncbi:MAG: flagellar biosynthesis protein FlhA [Pseudomonadota bacterium]
MRKDLMLVALLVVILALMVVPLATALLDLFLTLSLALAVVLLMAALYVRKTYEFSTLPTIILITTIFRLALSIATTRSILSEGEAGEIISTFGDFVVGGSVAIGLVIFLIITVVQFLVVTKGAERVAEVGARFALDALPGKQMSIDADIRAGNIDQEEGSRQRSLLDRESRFFGAMDGAMKFVKGDAIAGLVIIAINLIGGIAVGVTLHGYAVGEAIAVFSLLTVGDGLVAQIPALLVALAAGILVTRIDAGEQEDLGSRIADQLIADPRVLAAASIVVLGLCFVPGLPVWIFLGVAVVLGLSALFMQRARQAKEAQEGKTEPEEENVEDPDPSTAPNERFVLRLGADVLSAEELEDLIGRTTTKFETFALSYGLTFGPPVIEVSDALDPNEICIEIDDVAVHRDMRPESALPVKLDKLPKTATPVRLGADCSNTYWLPPQDYEMLAAKPQELPPFLQQVLYGVFSRHRGELFAMDGLRGLMDTIAVSHPAEVEAIRSQYSDVALYEIVRMLIEEGVPLKPYKLFAESFAYLNRSADTQSPIQIVDVLRHVMRRQMCRLLASPENVLGLILLDPEVETSVRQQIEGKPYPGGLRGIAAGSELSECLLSGVRYFLRTSHDSGPVLLVAADIRHIVRSHLILANLHIPVLAPHELSNDVRAIPLGRIHHKRTGNAKTATIEPIFEF